MLDDCCEIAINHGKFVKVDKCDQHLLDNLIWSCLETGGLTYARRTERLANGKQKTILLHRIIMNADDDQIVDHINGDGLDCRRSNMRIATKSQNSLNKRVKRSSRTGVKGVRKHSLCNKYQAEIKIPGGKRIYLGLFNTINEASDAYKKASEIHHGEFRREK